MAQRFYLLPLVLDAKGNRIPAYVDNDLPGIAGDMLDYGNEPWCLYTADVTGSQNTTLTAHADVSGLPANLGQTVGGALATVQAALANANIPENWITSGMTYRVMLQNLLKIFLIVQRIQGLTTVRIFDTGITLGTQLQNLSVGARNVLHDAVVSLGFDPSGLPGTTTLRQALKQCADGITLADYGLGPERWQV